MKGVMLAAYGTPSTMDDIERFYTDIRRGVKPSREQLEGLKARYAAIGGPSPLNSITLRQVDKLQRALDSEGKEMRVYSGMKHSRPSLGDTVRRMYDDGIAEALCIVLAPHHSITGTELYVNGVKEANNMLRGSIDIGFVRSWHMQSELIAFWSRSIAEAGKNAKDALVVFSAHSLPAKTEDKGTYRKQLMETSAAVAKASGLSHWVLAFQSRSGNADDWYGPTITEAVSSQREPGEDVIVAPIGFVSDNLEILYDIDIECMGWANSNGITLSRARLPNDSGYLTNALMGLVDDAA